MANVKKTLKETHPEIADMWAYELNGTLTPDLVSVNSDVEAYFRCTANAKHVFKKRIRKMVSDRDGHITGCIYCGPNAKVAFPGETDLLTVVKEAAKMWDYSKNTLDPTTLLPKSNKFAYFKCENGHSCNRKIQDFYHSPECPECQKQKCLLISNQPQVTMFWDYQKNSQIDLDTMIQSSRDIAWFQCPQCHYEWNTTVVFWRKNPYCACCGFDGSEYREIDHSITTLRMKVPEIDEFWDYKNNEEQTPDSLTWQSNFDAQFKCRAGHTFHRAVSKMFDTNKAFKGCQICTAERKEQAKEDEKQLLEERRMERETKKGSGNEKKRAFISFRTYNPEAAELWIDELNHGMTPDNTASKSGKTITMRCKRNANHTYPMKIYKIPKEEPYGCPYCRERSIVFPSETDLNSVSEIAKEMWDYETNTGYDLTAINPKSMDNVSWICNRGHHFERSIRGFLQSQNCPQCKKENSVIACFPHLIKQWDFKKNKGIDVNTTFASSDIEANWRCKKCGYEWVAQISSRKVGKGLCPCCELRTVVKEGVTDLFTMVPDLKNWYDEEKNEGVDTSSLSVTTHDQVWWKCPDCNHSWFTSPSSRIVYNDGNYSVKVCPVCSGARRTIPYSEEYPDLAARFVTELNSCSMDEINGSDTNTKFLWHCDLCGEAFDSTLRAMIRSRNTVAKGCSYCAGKKVTRENSFAVLHPEVMDEFDPSNEIDPYTVTENSTKQAKWNCRNDSSHTWEASFQARSKGQGGCNICRGYQYGKMFYEEHEDLEQYFDTEKNIRPFRNFSNMSNDYVWWKCEKGHSFQRTIYNTARMGAFKCSICENLMLQVGENDLASQFPDLAAEFDVEKNHILSEEITIASSNMDTWWKCPEGHEFQRSVYYRIHEFSECPVCNRTILVKGVNDFLHAYPQIEDIWDYEQNDRKPDDISDKADGKYNFTCPDGHRYITNLSTVIAHNFECMVCSKSIIQEGVNSLVDTDFELSQEFSPNEERKPTEFSNQSAYRALWRCPTCNNDYYWLIKDRRLGDDSCPFCTNRYTKAGINSLVDTDPELAKEYATDNEYDASRVNKESKTWAYWICPDCHGRYGAYVNERKVGDDSCPYCKNEMALLGYNSLVDTNELLAKEWSTNNDREPSEFTEQNCYQALWDCPTCHGEYSARICDRELGDCPYCSNKKTLQGYNTLKIRYPELMEEWDYINNYLLCNPNEILATYPKDVWWECKECHTKYHMSPKRRIYFQRRHMKSCSYCKGLRRKKKYFF